MAVIRTTDRRINVKHSYDEVIKKLEGGEQFIEVIEEVQRDNGYGSRTTYDEPIALNRDYIMEVQF